MIHPKKITLGRISESIAVVMLSEMHPITIRRKVEN